MGTVLAHCVNKAVLVPINGMASFLTDDVTFGSLI